MSLEKERFKTDFINSSIELIKRTWLKMIVVEFIFTIVIKLIFSLSSVSVPEISNWPEFLSYLIAYGIVFKCTTAGDYLIMIIVFFLVLFLVFVILLIVLIPIILRINALLFSIMKNETEGQRLSMLQLLSKPFKRKVPRTGSFFLVTVVLLAYFVSKQSLIIRIPLLAIIILKSLLTFPAYFLGGMSYSNSFNFSFQQMTIKRCVQVVGYCVPIFIAFFFLDYILKSMTYNLPEIYSFGLEILFTVFFMSIGYFLLTGLYYRYKNEED